MVFSSITFLSLFLPLIFLLHWVAPKMWLKNGLLTVASLLFYAWGEPVYVYLMLFSVLVNWLFGLGIHRFFHQKKWWVATAVVVNIGLLFYFKYGNFAVELLNYLPFVSMEATDIRLPIGISFFTFQAMSYVFDVAKKEANVQKNPIHLLLYISLFPQLIAGPIVKYHDVEAQIYSRSTTVNGTAKGIRRFVIGLAKKVLLANQMALLADTIFALAPAQLDGLTAWIGAVAYLFQIYFDFSGYSDMAIGLGQMFGFNFLENFRYPLVATGIQDFWRRWHISLSTWFREYLYIPLGGNRKGTARRYVNQFVVFFATGLWHGANFTFILWGLLHGLFLSLETQGIIPIRKVKQNWIKRLYTLFVVTLLFVLFRADNVAYALGYYQAMFSGFWENIPTWSLVFPFFTTYMWYTVAMCFLASSEILPWCKKRLETKGTLCRVPAGGVEVATYVVTFGLFLWCLLSLSTNGYNPFIYFRF
ncbi:MAG: MBOAT family O-acyltransferase [Eubacteriales bacterium]